MPGNTDIERTLPDVARTHSFRANGKSLYSIVHGGLRMSAADPLPRSNTGSKNLFGETFSGYDVADLARCVSNANPRTKQPRSHGRETPAAWRRSNFVWRSTPEAAGITETLLPPTFSSPRAADWTKLHLRSGSFLLYDRFLRLKYSILRSDLQIEFSGPLSSY